MKKEPEAFIESRIFEEKGIGQVVVCRYKSNGSAEVGVFLVDVWCLGVKNAFFTRFDSPNDREQKLERMFRGEVPPPKPAANGRKLVEGAIAYAKALGLAPHPDYKKGARVFGGINPKDATESYTFGKNGKPFFISGPDDNADRILAILRRKLDDSDFHFLVAEDSLNELMNEFDEDE